MLPGRRTWSNHRAQTVARAELQALVVALEAVPTATVYTDCQSNVCSWEWVRKYELPRVAIAKRASEDLVGRLAVVVSLMYKVDLPVPERTSAQDSRPKPRPGQPRIAPLDVSELILEPGCFVDEKGQTLQAIHMIAPKMAGIALLNASQASPWLPPSLGS